jgi:hypothetical protein
MSRPAATILLVLLCLAVAGVAGRRLTQGATTVAGDTVRVSDEYRRAGLRFAPEVSAGDRAWIQQAIAVSRPEAQRLVAEVDGLVTVETAGSRQMMGLTQMRGQDFRVWLNVVRLNGTRQVDRATTVMHELGHVVDLALIDDERFRALDAGIPRGGNCDEVGGVSYGSCAVPEERVADTFAKWALGGSVSAIGAGYAIAAPPSLEDWGRPLVALGADLSG